MTWDLVEWLQSHKSSRSKSVRPTVECLEDRVTPAVIHVGPEESIQTIAQAVTVAQNGDDVQIDAGTYTGSGIFGVWWQSNLTIEAVGGHAHLDASGLYIPNLKGIFVIDGTNVTVKGIEFSGAHDTVNTDANWAGIREEGTNLTVNDCIFHNNDDGLLAGANLSSNIVIDYSQFYQNGYGDGYSHNMYIGNVNSFTLEYSYSANANNGRLVKSRAESNYLLYNRITDETGNADVEVDFANGGLCYLIGNLIEKIPAANNNHTLIMFGGEGETNTLEQLYLVNNTLVIDQAYGTFVNVFGSPTNVLLQNNIFCGSGTTLSGPGTLVSNLITASDPGFVNRAGFDYHLTAGSAAIDAGTDPGSAYGFSLTPTNQYVPVANTQPRPVVGALDIGAYEYGNAITVPAAPANLLATAGDGQVALSWSASSGESGYNVYRWNGSSYVVIANVAGTFFPDTGLTNGSTYWYEVTAVNGAGESNPAGPVSATPQAVQAAPRVTAISPASGSTAGGTSVTLTGANFMGTTAVWFGSVAATSFTVNSAGQITAIAPAQAASTVDVTVVTGAGTSAISAADRFQYLAPLPAVSKLSKTQGPTSGGTTLTINGSNFTGVTAVYFGSVRATSFTVKSATSITVTAPAHAAGTVDVTVVTAAGTSALTAADRFTYFNRPIVSKVSPASGPTTGGTAVTISGQYLAGATKILFGSVAASFVFNADGTITAWSPEEVAGTVNIFVVTPGGTSAKTTADRFRYV
jgi:hypothetical protein